jgi:RimJ/RimL family protein N-acetyltransferase
VHVDLRGVDLTTEVVRTERLVLRPYRPEDEDAVFRACQDPAIQRWNIPIASPYPRAVAREWVCELAPRLRAEGRGMPVVVEAGGELVGSSGLEFDGGLLGPAIGYWMAPWGRGRRYAAEAVDALARWVLARGAPRVHLMVDVRNTASGKVAQRARFTREGVVHRCLPYRDGSYGDAVLFGRVE